MQILNIDVQFRSSLIDLPVALIVRLSSLCACCPHPATHDTAYYRFQMNWKPARIWANPAGFGPNPENEIVLIPTSLYPLLTGSRQTKAFKMTTTNNSQTFIMAEPWRILDGDRLVLRGCGCNNFIIFIIYNIIRARGCIYIFIIPKIGFRIGDRSFGRSRRRRRRLGALTRLLTVLETQKFHPMVALLRGIWKS